MIVNICLSENANKIGDENQKSYTTLYAILKVPIHRQMNDMYTKYFKHEATIDLYSSILQNYIEDIKIKCIV